jgi:hypothetical protein
MLVYKFDSAYQLGINSVESKMEDVWMLQKQPIQTWWNLMQKQI